MTFWDTFRQKTNEFLSNELLNKASRLGEGVLEISSKIGESNHPITMGSAILSGINLMADVMNIQVSGPFQNFINKKDLKLKTGRLHHMLLSANVQNVFKVHQVMKFGESIMKCIDMGPLTKVYYFEPSTKEEGTLPPSLNYYICKDFDITPLHDFFWATFPNGVTVMCEESASEYAGLSMVMKEIPYNEVFFQTTEHSVEDIVNYIKESKKHNVSRSFLLYGPPGTGKTTWVEQISQHFNNRILKLDAVSLGELLNGEMDNLMSFLNPQIVLFDDFDRLHFEEMEGQLLLITDHLKRKYPDICFFATINDHTQISSAVLRAGRFDEKIEFNLPTVDNVVFLVENFCNKNHVDFDKKQVKKILTELECSFTPAECKEAVLRKKLKPETTWSWIFKELKKYQDFGGPDKDEEEEF